MSCKSYANPTPPPLAPGGGDDTLGIVDRRRPGRSTGITLARRHRSLRHVLGVVQSLLEATHWDVTVEVSEGRMVSRCAVACLCGLQCQCMRTPCGVAGGRHPCGPRGLMSLQEGRWGLGGAGAILAGGLWRGHDRPAGRMNAIRSRACLVPHRSSGHTAHAAVSCPRDSDEPRSGC